MPREQIEKRINQVLDDVIGEHYTPQATRQEMEMDSLDEVEVIMGIEEEFGFEIPDEDCPAIQTVADLYAYVKRKVEPEAAPE